MGLHRNSQKRIYIPGATYFITTVTHGRYPYFEEELFRELFVDELLFCSELKSFSLYAYAVMPDHAHVLLRPMGRWNYSGIMFSLKKQFSHMANCVMGFNTLYDVTIPWDDRVSGAAHPEGAPSITRAHSWKIVKTASPPWRPRPRRGPMRDVRRAPGYRTKRAA